jgi:hypothetical protein
VLVFAQFQNEFYQPQRLIIVSGLTARGQEGAKLLFLPPHCPLTTRLSRNAAIFSELQFCILFHELGHGQACFL